MPAVLLYFVSLGFRSLRWHFLLLHLKPIPIRRLYPVIAIGYLAHNLLPVRLGEFVRAHLLGERETISKVSSLGTIAAERVLDGLTLVFFVLVIWTFLPWTEVLKDKDGSLNPWWVGASGGIAIAFFIGFAAMYLVAICPRIGEKLADSFSAVFPKTIRSKINGSTHLLIDGFGSLRSPSMLGLICLISVPVWLTEGLMYYLLSISFHLDQPFQVIVLVTAIANLATALPSTAGSFGPFEVGAKASLVAFGVADEAAVAYSIFLHTIALWLPVNLLGLFFLWKESLSPAKLAKGEIK